MTGNRELTRRVCGLTVGLVAGLALVLGVGFGLVEAAGAIAGGGIALANFLWLRSAVDAAVRRAAAGSTGWWRRVLWAGASGARLGVVALALGVLIAQGWIGLGGLLASLVIFPLALVAGGLRTVRAA